MLTKTILLLGLGAFAPAAIVGVIIWFSDSSPEEPTEDTEEYDVCSKHGHDLRDHKSDGIESSFKPISAKWGITYGIDITVVPGRLIGLQHLTEKQVAPCRDCEYEKTQEETIDRQIVFAKNGELKTMDYSQYESLAEEK